MAWLAGRATPPAGERDLEGAIADEYGMAELAGSVTSSAQAATGAGCSAWDTDVRIRLRPGRADSGVKLYVTDHEADGPHEYMANTGFLRYPGLFSALAGLLGEFPVGQKLRVLIVPLSVGLEAVSLAVAARAIAGDRPIVIEGFDISRKATELARSGVYPRLFFPDDLSAFGGALRDRGDGHVAVAPEFMARIGVLDAGDVLAFGPDRPYDMVVCLNLMMHMAEDDRPALVEKLAALTAPGGILCLNNNQEWPGELVPYFARLTAPGGGFVSLHEGLERGPVPEGSTAAGPAFAVTDANAMMLRRRAA